VAGPPDSISPAGELQDVFGHRIIARQAQRGGRVREVLEVGHAVEACCGGLAKECGGVVGAPGCGVQEGMVRSVEGVEV
jgi:hypothetical protein